MQFSIPVAALMRFSLATVYLWFGIVKVVGQSPMNPVITKVTESILPFAEVGQVTLLLGIFEILLAMLFLIPQTSRLALLLLVPHVIATVLPLFLLPEMCWTQFLIPTLEGQFIIKNIFIIAIAITLFMENRKHTRVHYTLYPQS